MIFRGLDSKELDILQVEWDTQTLVALHLLPTMNKEALLILIVVREEPL
jgi:hypothetical protein